VFISHGATFFCAAKLLLFLQICKKKVIFATFWVLWGKKKHNSENRVERLGRY